MLDYTKAHNAWASFMSVASRSSAELLQVRPDSSPFLPDLCRTQATVPPGLGLNLNLQLASLGLDLDLLVNCRTWT